MRLDLTALLEGRASSQEWDFTYTPDADGPLLPDDIRLTEPIAAHVVVTAHYGYLALTADASCVYETECARCLDVVSRTLTVHAERIIETDAASGGGTQRDADYEDNLLTMENGTADAQDCLTEEILLNLPMYHLCREDCPGLCPRCGKKRAEGGCTCDAKKEIDPRLAILQKLLEKPEE
jgi:uncharacterized protein